MLFYTQIKREFTQASWKRGQNYFREKRVKDVKLDGDIVTGNVRGSGKEAYLTSITMARGTIGWPDYPHPTPSTLDFTTKQRGNYWFQPRWPEAWFPEAFRGTMGDLLLALKHNRPPAINGRDNLHTLALVEAVFRSARDHRMVELAEIIG